MPLLPILLGVGGGLTALGLFGFAIWYCCFRGAPEDDRPLYGVLCADRNHDPSGQQVANWANSPGGQIINNQVLGGLNHGNVLAFSNRVHAVLAGPPGLWTWNALLPGEWEANGCQLLDGVRDEGECAMPAQALFVLLTYPNPYGFNQAADNFEIRQYHGARNNGFIAAHANTPFNLAPNNYGADGVARNYYIWSNHKTLRYNGRYYDPSYSTTQGGPGYYDNEADMAVAQIYGEIQQGDNQFPNNILVEQIVMTDNAAPALLKGFYITVWRSIADNHMAADADELLGNLAGFRATYVGPFNPAGVGGNTGNSFGFDNTHNYLNGFAFH